MSAWTMVIFLCLAAVPREACDEETAISVIRPVDRYPMQMGCAIASMQALATVETSGDTYPTVKCEGRR